MVSATGAVVWCLRDNQWVPMQLSSIRLNGVLTSAHWSALNDILQQLANQQLIVQDTGDGFKELTDLQKTTMLMPAGGGGDGGTAMIMRPSSNSEGQLTALTAPPVLNSSDISFTSTEKLARTIIGEEITSPPPSDNVNLEPLLVEDNKATSLTVLNKDSNLNVSIIGRFTIENRDEAIIVPIASETTTSAINNPEEDSNSSDPSNLVIDELVERLLEKYKTVNLGSTTNKMKCDTIQENIVSDCTQTLPPNTARPYKKFSMGSLLTTDHITNTTTTTDLKPNPGRKWSLPALRKRSRIVDDEKHENILYWLQQQQQQHDTINEKKCHNNNNNNNNSSSNNLPKETRKWSLPMNWKLNRDDNATGPNRGDDILYSLSHDQGKKTAKENTRKWSLPINWRSPHKHNNNQQQHQQQQHQENDTKSDNMLYWLTNQHTTTDKSRRFSHCFEEDLKARRIAYRCERRRSSSSELFTGCDMKLLDGGRGGGGGDDSGIEDSSCRSSCDSGDDFRTNTNNNNNNTLSNWRRQFAHNSNNTNSNGGRKISTGSLTDQAYCVLTSQP